MSSSTQHPYPHHNHKVFIPGRVCMLGEHSDWASSYKIVEQKDKDDDVDSTKSNNNNIFAGACLAYNTDCGIDLEGTLSSLLLENSSSTKQITLEYEFRPGNKSKTIPFTFEALQEVALAEGDFFTHVCATAAEVLSRFSTSSSYQDRLLKQFSASSSSSSSILIKITCTSMSLPMMKGLSSSAAVAVGLAKILGNFIGINFSESELMDIAYCGERRTGSKCGRLDQCVAFGPHAFIKLDFSRGGDHPPDCKPLHVSTPFYFVICDLKKGKNTKVILRDLNSAYPVPKDEIDCAVHEALGPINLDLIKKAEDALSKGDAVLLGKLFTEAQKVFDKMIAPKCIAELAAPKLHKVLEHDDVKKNSLGGKGVGSQGDGSAQFVCADQKQQEALCRVLEEELDCAAMKFILNQ